MRAPLRWLAGGAATAAALGAVLVAPGRRPGTLAAAEPADTAITSRSIAYFEKRLVSNPDNYMVKSRLVSRYVLRFGTGADPADVARAEALARDLVHTVPARGAALSRLSGVLLMQHKFAQSLDAATEALALDSLGQDALGAWFDAALAVGRYGEAETALARLRPGTLAAQVRRAQWLDASGRSEAAYDTFDRICRQLERSGRRPPVVAWCLTQLAAVEHARRGPDAAAALWRRALQVQPGYRGALEGLGGLAAARGEWSRAAELYFRIAVDAHPDLYLRVAEAAAALGDSVRAKQYERRFLAVAGRPENEALFGEALALFYAERGAPWGRDSALALALRDLTRRPTVESYDVLSWVRYLRREPVQALAASDRAQHWGSPTPTMDYHRARILEALGRGTEAALFLHRALAHPTLLPPHVRRDLASRP
jgi:tetratricopeptide (TPR) repeat protein